MEAMCCYYIVVLKIGLLALSSTALPLSSVMMATRHPEDAQKTYHLKVDPVVGAIGPQEGPLCVMAMRKDSNIGPDQPTFEKHNITYRVQNYTSGLPQNVVDGILQKAFQVWANVTPLTFTQTTFPADIEIKFVSGDHGDFFPFEGHGRVLAHAFLPGPGTGSDVHFNEDENWTIGRHGFNLFLVALHEIGHSLGLGHSEDKSDMMFRKYKYVETDGFILPSGDVKAIQALYGPPVRSIQTPTQTSDQTPTEEPSICDPDMFMDAAVKINRSIFIFKNGFYQKARSSEVIPVYNTWPSIVSNIDAAVQYHRTNQETNYAFFTGSRYWLYTGNVLRSGFPRPISDFGFLSNVTKIDAAMRVDRSWILFFVGEQFWRYNIDENEMSSSSPSLIADVFSNISTVDAAVKDHGDYYLTSGLSVYKYHGTKLIISSRQVGWMNCT
ncbi:stromelysin-1-like [Scyliorhinus torazame]|uniref:stromelysin-1-like n=1 Tax=Scyliorhinus torazame TaxID=75743 RepID=UPI003B5A47BF